MADFAGDSPPVTSERHARLLQRLHSNRDELERLRRTLVKFFDWRGLWPADECADETLDRLARRLEENVMVDDLRSHAQGAARMVLMERRRREAPASVDLAPPPPMTAAGAASPIAPCLTRCLAELPEDERTLVQRYYEGERRFKAGNRRLMASRLVMSEQLLRSRVHRLRDRLEACVRSCFS